MKVTPGTKLGPYKVQSRLGAGGMGVVYRARDERLDRDVAIKVLPPGLITDETARRRFRKEALALARLSHPNIAAVHDVGEQDDSDYLVMEYLAGQSLADRLKAGPLPIKEVIAYGAQIAAAMEEAHEHCVVHRDLKPANIIISPKGHAKVLDFDLAQILAEAGSETPTQSITQTRGIAGTPQYMSPEQAEGKQFDSRTPDGYTHGAAWSSNSIAGLMKVLDEVRKNGPRPGQIAATKHEDLLMQTRMYHGVSGTEAYLRVVCSMAKADKPEGYTAMLKKFLVPTFEEQLNKGVATYYGVDEQYVNTSAPSTRCVVITYPNAESMDKWATAINTTMGKWSPAERAEFAGATVPDSRRDILARITHSGHK